MSGLNYIDFNELYAVSTAISMAYIYISSKSKKSELSFLNFLKDMTEWAAYSALQLKTKPQQKEETTLARLRYYLNSDKLTNLTSGKLSVIEKIATKNLDKIKEFEEKKRRALSRATKSEYLHVISTDCFLYGVLLLFVGVLETKLGFSIGGKIFLTNLMILIFLLHCILFDRFSEQCSSLFRPRIGTHMLLFFIFVTVIFLSPISNAINILGKYNILFTPIICFCGFLLYFIVSFICCVVHIVVCWIQLLRMKLDLSVQEHKVLLEECENEFNEIDKQLIDNINMYFDNNNE